LRKEPSLDYAYDRDKCVVFCVDVEHATKMAEAFNAADIKAGVIHGALPKDDRKQLLQDFHDGKLRVITNCMVLTEGWDEPGVNCIIHAAPTPDLGSDLIRAEAGASSESHGKWLRL
jgi:superfamily II DNA or RNA helicase